jgi:hypothetical protein
VHVISEAPRRSHNNFYTDRLLLYAERVEQLGAWFAQQNIVDLRLKSLANAYIET